MHDDRERFHDKLLTVSKQSRIATVTVLLPCHLSWEMRTELTMDLEFESKRSGRGRLMKKKKVVPEIFQVPVLPPRIELGFC